VPFFIPGLKQNINDDYRIPVEVRIEPERLINQLGAILTFVSISMI
jgi:paraquat-inducible protein B